MPLHVLLADTVESQSGSQLIKILNRFGICDSSDTLSRFVQYKVNSLEKASSLTQKLLLLSPLTTWTLNSVLLVSFVENTLAVGMGPLFRQLSLYHHSHNARMIKKIYHLKLIIQL